MSFAYYLFRLLPLAVWRLSLSGDYREGQSWGLLETFKRGSPSIVGKVRGGLIPRSATLRITPVNRFRVARCLLRTEVVP